MAAPETFDPKRYTPFEVGVPSEKILCTFPAIDTVVDNIKISQGLEHIAKVLDRGTLIRSHVVADLGNILHSRHQYHWHTGYVPPQTVAAPHLGVVDRQGPRAEEPGDPGVHQHRPAAGGASARSEELKAFTTAGFFGSEYGPFNLPYPLDAIAAVRPPKGMTRERFARREQTYRRLIKESPLGEPGQRLPPGVDAARDGQRPPPAQLARARRLRPVQGAEGELRPLQHRPLRPGLPAGPPADRGRARVSSR